MQEVAISVKNSEIPVLLAWHVSFASAMIERACSMAENFSVFFYIYQDVFK